VLTVSDGRLDEVLRAFGDVVDLKAPYFHGHASGTADLCEQLAAKLGFSDRDSVAVRRAALVHDLGRAGIANGIWERDGALRAEDWGQVKLHPYHSEQVLETSRALAAVAPIAGAHHERLDGSGYYRRLNANALPMTARALAAASAFQAMIQPRPHRAALPVDVAAEELRAGAKQGMLDVDAVEAVLGAAGRPGRVRRKWPVGLTDRQVEVLRLVASGLSNRDVAARLQVSTRTAEHHIQDVYMRIGLSSRAAAALFAMEHHLLEPKDW
jgi:HD-GYP domain-containing protein (c-di-GMP phosphodiesterase class II)/DNA-binding CsgD family transcriptional regulator